MICKPYLHIRVRNRQARNYDAVDTLSNVIIPVNGSCLSDHPTGCIELLLKFTFMSTRGLSWPLRKQSLQLKSSECRRSPCSVSARCSWPSFLTAPYMSDFVLHAIDVVLYYLDTPFRLYFSFSQYFMFIISVYVNLLLTVQCNSCYIIRQITASAIFSIVICLQTAKVCTLQCLKYVIRRVDIH